MAAFPLVLPSLNQRKEDIPSLVSIFLSELTPKYGKQVLGLNQEARMLKSELKTNLIDLNKTLEEINQDFIEFVLSEENYNYSKSAKRLGISRSTLWRKREP